jgi:hypothetical protein
MMMMMMIMIMISKLFKRAVDYKIYSLFVQRKHTDPAKKAYQKDMKDLDIKCITLINGGTKDPSTLPMKSE